MCWFGSFTDDGMSRSKCVQGEVGVSVTHWLDGLCLKEISGTYHVCGCFLLELITLPANAHFLIFSFPGKGSTLLRASNFPLSPIIYQFGGQFLGCLHSKRLTTYMLCCRF